MKPAIVIATPLIVFVLSMVMGWNAAAPPVPVEEEPKPLTRLSPRQRAQQASVATRAPKSKADQFEARISRYNPALPTKQYDGEGMDQAIRKSNHWGGSCFVVYEDLKYATGWAAVAPEEMFHWLVTKNGERIQEADILFSSWVELSPQRALRASLEIPDAKLRAQALMTCVVHLSKTSPSLAREALVENLSLYAPGQYDSVHYGDDVGGEAIELVASLPASKERSALLATLMGHMSDEEVVVAHWNELSHSEMRELVDAGFGTTPIVGSTDDLEYKGLENVLREHAELSQDSSSCAHLIRLYGEKWAQRDLMGAMDWVDRQMKGRARVDAMESLWYHSAAHDPMHAVQLWRGLPDGQLKQALSSKIVDGTPEEQRPQITEMLRHK